MEAFNKVPVKPVYEQIRATELEVGRRYPLEKLEKTCTRYGNALLAFIFIDGEPKKIFLPKIYADSLSDQTINDVNENGNFDLVLAEHVFPSFRFEIMPKVPAQELPPHPPYQK